MKIKYNVIDTNIFLIDPVSAIYGFGPKKEGFVNYLIIPAPVLEEIDNFKGEYHTDRGFNARVFSRKLKEIKKDSGKSFAEPIPLQENYFLKIAMDYDPVSFSNKESSIDDCILGTAKYLQRTDPDSEVELVTNDNILYVKASVLGLEASDWRGARAVQSTEKIYKGWRTVRVSKDIICGLSRGLIDVAKTKLDGLENLMPNEYILFLDELLPADYEVPNFDESSVNTTNFALGKYIKSIQGLENGGIKEVKPRASQDSKIVSIGARNFEQSFALDALLDPRIKLVNLIGPAGTGKTLLGVATGLDQLKTKYTKDKGIYRRMLISKLMISSAGEELGILPGEIEEKMHPYLTSIYDNFKPDMFNALVDKMTKSSKERNEIKSSAVGNLSSYLMENGNLEIQPLSVIRGRSLDSGYFMLEEAQNTSIAEIKTLITRAGEGTKMVINGDREQMDRKGQTDLINGLMHSSERFKEQEISASVTLSKGERSELATLGSKLL